MKFTAAISLLTLTFSASASANVSLRGKKATDDANTVDNATGQQKIRNLSSNEVLIGSAKYNSLAKGFVDGTGGGDDGWWIRRNLCVETYSNQVMDVTYFPDNLSHPTNADRGLQFTSSSHILSDTDCASRTDIGNGSCDTYIGQIDEGSGTYHEVYDCGVPGWSNVGGNQPSKKTTKYVREVSFDNGVTWTVSSNGEFCLEAFEDEFFHDASRAESQLNTLFPKYHDYGTAPYFDQVQTRITVADQTGSSMYNDGTGCPRATGSVLSDDYHTGECTLVKAVYPYKFYDCSPKEEFVDWLGSAKYELNNSGGETYCVDSATLEDDTQPLNYSPFIPGYSGDRANGQVNLLSGYDTFTLKSNTIGSINDCEARGCTTFEGTYFDSFPVYKC